MDNKDKKKDESSKKKAGKKWVKLNELSKKNTDEIWYVLTKGNKLQLRFMDRRCKI